MVPGGEPAPSRPMPRCLEVPWVCSCVDGGSGPALGAHRHSSTDAGNSHRARRVALACEIVGEDYITRSKTARGAIADPDFICPARIKMYCRRCAVCQSLK